MTDPTIPAAVPEDTQPVAPGVPAPADVTNEVNTPPADAPAGDAAIYTEVVNEDGSRTLEILIGTSYFEIADAAEVTISAFELANRNGVHNSVYEIPAGATVVIPAPQLPVVTEPPLVDLETATQQNIASQNAIGSIAAQAVDAQAMIDPGFAAQAAGVEPISIPGGLAPSSAAVPVTPGTVGEVIEAPLGASIEVGTADDGNAEATIVAPILTPEGNIAAVSENADNGFLPPTPAVDENGDTIIPSTENGFLPQSDAPADLSAEPAPTGEPVSDVPPLTDPSAGA